MSARIVPLPRRYWKLPPDAFGHGDRHGDVVPDGNGQWMALDQTRNSGGVLVRGVPKATALFIGAAFALRHGASLTLHMNDVDRAPAVLLDWRGGA
jgi:hypothetical protein